VNTQAKLYRLEAEFETARSGEAVARQLLEFLTGRTVKDIVASNTGFPYLNQENDYVAKALLRPDVLAAEQAWGVSKKKVLIAKSDFFPTVSLSGNYYTARNTTPNDREWDAGLDISVPIFEGTQTIGNVQEATLKARESELLLQRARRLAATDIRDAYVRLKDSIAMTKAMTKALSSAVQNYRLQRDDYVLNLVSNLDVLDAIRAMGESRRDYVHSLFETKRLYWKLCVATGELPQNK
jgi:outer membrane protein TolC